MHEDKLELKWIPWADRLLIGATLLALLLVLLPLSAFSPSSWPYERLPPAACTANVCLVSGYVVGILAHYRLLFGCNRIGPRINPEPAEKLIVRASLVVSAVAFGLVLLFPP